jgi:hypothetical protein
MLQPAIADMQKNHAANLNKPITSPEIYALSHIGRVRTASMRRRSRLRVPGFALAMA